MKDRISQSMHSALAHVSRAAGLYSDLYLAPLKTDAPIRKIVFLCKGNICRSPYAAAKLRALLTEPGFEISSAGLDTTPGKPADDTALRIASEHGIDLSKHQTCRPEPGALKSADLVVIMDRSHKALLKKLAPEVLPKTLYLGSLNPDLIEGVEIRDPYGLPDAEFRACYSRIDLALKKLVEETLLAR